MVCQSIRLVYSPGTAGVPFFNPDGPGCRSVQATIAADWTFKIEGISGTCGAPPQGMFGRWTLKADNRFAART